jgi:hypothetical protein
MLSKLRPRLTYANVISSLCLFIVLGGSSYAAIALNENSIKSRHIANGQVKTSDLARNAVTTKKVRDASLLAQDFAPNQLPHGPKGDTGGTGGTGPQGPKGDKGDAGPQGIPGPVDTSALQTKVAKSGDTLTGMVTENSAPGESLGVVGDSWGAVLPVGVAEPTYDFVTSPNPQCPGVGQATAGRLCVYVLSQSNRHDGYEIVWGDVWNATNRRYGWAFELEWTPPTQNGIGWLNASWAYQVP